MKFKKIKAIFLTSLLSFCLVNTNSVKSADLGPFGHSIDIYILQKVYLIQLDVLDFLLYFMDQLYPVYFLKQLKTLKILLN